MAINDYVFDGSMESGGESKLFPVNTDTANDHAPFAKVKHTITLQSAGRSSTELDHVKLDDDDLVEVDLGSVTLLMKVSELRICSLADADCVAGAYKLPTKIVGDSGSSRGFVGFAIRALRVLGINLPEMAIQRAASAVEGWIKDDSPGLYKVDINGELLRESLPTDNRPVLLLLHGTASSTEKAFADLLPSKTRNLPERTYYWKTLYEQFSGRIFALEQRTLTEAPISNVLQFLDKWSPQGGPPLVLLSHSRGGIVGDFISSLQDWKPLSTSLLTALGENSTEAQQLLDLQHRVDTIAPDRRPHVLRHIRVGTPAAGTTLASEKTHIWLSILSSLGGFLPGVGTAISAIADLAVAVVKQGLEPGTLPGIDAQKPDNPLVKVAQLLRCEQTDLLAVTGNSQGEIKQMVRLIFGDSNDLIVNTDSMLLGPQYKARHQLAIDDTDIIHTAYFEHPKFRAVLDKALAGNLSDSGFEKLGQQTITRSSSGERGHISAAEPDDAIDKPCMFLLPGIMGSELSVGPEQDERDVWLDIWQLFLGEGNKLQLENATGNAAEQVRVSGVLEKGYANFVEHVRSGEQFHIIPHAYDWRRSVFDPVDALEERVQQRLAVATRQPIVFVCHSMGGLVARAWRHTYRKTWDQVVEGNGRMIQLGTPNYGSWTVPRILRSEEKILLALTLLDMSNDKASWLKMVSQFPGLLELCDFDDERLDLLDTKSWQEIIADDAVVQPLKLLETAKKNRKELGTDNFEQDENIIYVAGVSEKTPALDKTGNQRRIIDLRNAGDGRVLWPKRADRKQPDYYIEAVHGDLLDSRKHFDALLELASTGKTKDLTTTQPTADKRGGTSTASTVSASQTVREKLGLNPDVVLFPGLEELQAAALGGSVSQQSDPVTDEDTLILSVTHGNLMYCNCPVLVGHYTGDGIKYAERALDTALNGVLSQRRNLGAEFYAGAVGTHEVALRRPDNKDPGPDGAIVVGLGHMNELKKGGLITTVRNGVLKYAQVCSEQRQDCSALKVASLLIGSGQEALALLDVLDGIVQGVSLANKILKNNRADDAPVVRVAELEFIEWHLDIAIVARQKLERLSSTLEFKPVIRPGLYKTDGGHKRPYLADNTDWWDVLKVRMEQDKPAYPLATLKFSTPGSRALGISTSVKFNPREIDRFLAPVLANTNAPDPKQIEALFEQLIPAPLKPLAAQRRNLVVNMDPESAYLPWEIMVDRKSPNGEPIAVTAGMVRRIMPEPDDMMPDRFERAEGNRALIVGNPPGGPEFPNLVGAHTESVQLNKLLSGCDWTVNASNVFPNTELLLGQETAANIRRDIFVEDYRILHFAAHGIHDSEYSGNSGVVIGYDQMTDSVELFSPHHVSAIRHKPSLVFINCCHTGRFESQDFSFHKLSASLATEFIKSGVHCVIGAGWAVDDAAALHFAYTVYTDLLSGESFGEAVHRARQEVYKKYPLTNTWAAFQCYGDPGFVLSGGKKSARHKNKPVFFHISEMLCALENIRSDLAGSKDPGGSGDHAIKLREANTLLEVARETIDQENGELWSARGDVLTHLIIIYCELDKEKKALELLKLATAADRSDVSLADLLIVANYEARYAERRYYTAHKAADSDSDKNKLIKAECIRTIETVIESLELYRHVHNSPAVHQNLASAYKLYAMINASTSAVKVKYLNQMIESYTAAADCAGNKSVYYPASNAVLGYALLRKMGDPVTDKQRVEINRLKTLATDSLPGKTSKNFWDIVAHLDTDFIFALDENRLTPALAKNTAQQILNASKRYGSPGQLDSIIKQFRCVRILARSNDTAVRNAADRAYEIIRGSGSSNGSG